MKQKVKFFSKYEPAQARAEYNCGKTIVDAAGYVSPKQRITNIIRAGERLEEYRREMYDYGVDDEDDGVFIDPLRSPGLDLVDYSRIQAQSLARIREQSRRKKEDKSEGTKAESPKDDKPETALPVEPDGA